MRPEAAMAPTPEARPRPTPAARRLAAARRPASSSSACSSVPWASRSCSMRGSLRLSLFGLGFSLGKTGDGEPEYQLGLVDGDADFEYEY